MKEVEKRLHGIRASQGWEEEWREEEEDQRRGGGGDTLAMMEKKEEELDDFLSRDPTAEEVAELLQQR